MVEENIVLDLKFFWASFQAALSQHLEALYFIPIQRQIIKTLILISLVGFQLYIIHAHEIMEIQ